MVLASHPAAKPSSEHTDRHVRPSPFEEEVASRFGLVPNFFCTAQSAPGLIEELWLFAKAAYLDNPLPSIFKERLFVHLSRFCEVRYCLVRHVGFLVGLGKSAGDPCAEPHTIAEAVMLLRRPAVLHGEALDAALTRLENTVLRDIPDMASRDEEDVFAAATVIFLEPARSIRARDALIHALDDTTTELLTAFMAFIRAAHYWTLTHPDLTFEEDVEQMMQTNETLTRLMFADAREADHDMSRQLYDELVLLRRERDDRIALRFALAEREKSQRHQQLLINELNHRVKNTLAIVQSLAHQTLKGAEVSNSSREALTARLVALAQAHDLLTTENWEGASLSSVLALAVGVHTSANDERVKMEGPDLKLAPKQALSIAMAMHELATNAAKYGSLSNDTGQIDIRWQVGQRQSEEWLTLCWQESGGPVVAPLAKTGFGMRLVQHGLAAELGGDVLMDFLPTGLICTVSSPVPLLEET